MGCGEVWKMPTNGPALVTAVLFTYGKHARSMVRTPVGLSWAVATPLRSTGTKAVVHPARATTSISKQSELSPLQTACRFGDHAGDAC